MVPYPKDITNVKVDLDDDPKERIADVFAYTNQFIDDATSGGGVVLVHCAAGISRSATILAWYIVTKTGATPAAVIRHLRSKRPIVNPNPGFLNALAVESLKRGAHNKRASKGKVNR
jgi:protein-tyrosine phosphatase